MIRILTTWTLRAARAISLPTLGCVALCALAAPAQAVPPTPATVLVEAARAQPKPANAVVTYVEFTASGPHGAPAPPPGRALRVVVAANGRLRVDVQDLHRGTTTTLLFAPGATSHPKSPRTPPASPEAPRPETQAPAWLLWLAGRPIDRILEAKHVVRDVTSLAHIGPTILWVFGADPHGGDQPQIQIARDTGRLRRIVEVDMVANSRVVRAAQLDGQAGPAGPAASWPATLRLRAGNVVTVYELRRIHTGQLPSGSFTLPPPPPAPPRDPSP